MKKYTICMLVVLVALSVSCDLLLGSIEASEILIDTRWQITDKPANEVHNTLLFTTGGSYLFLDENGQIFECGSTSNMTETSYEFIIELQRDRPELNGVDRYAEFKITGDTLVISYYRDPEKSEFFITFTASRITEPVRIANSVDDFSGEQDTYGWSYGYRVDPFDLESFVPFTTFDSESMFWTAGDTFWTRMGPDWVAPNGPITSGIDKEPTEHRPTRRWTSPLDGTVHVNGVLKKLSSNQSTDGVSGSVSVNGIEIWADSIDGTDTTGVEFELSLNLSHDDVVEFLLAPRENDWADNSYFTGEIWVGR